MLKPGLFKNCTVHFCSRLYNIRNSKSSEKNALKVITCLTFKNNKEKRMAQLLTEHRITQLGLIFSEYH